MSRTARPTRLSSDQDYRWIIEEDRTVYIDPAVESAPGTPVRNLAINFYSSHMPVVAQGCTGPISCEAGSDTPRATGGVRRRQRRLPDD